MSEPRLKIRTGQRIASLLPINAPQPFQEFRLERNDMTVTVVAPLATETAEIIQALDIMKRSIEEKASEG